MDDFFDNLHEDFDPERKLTDSQIETLRDVEENQEKYPETQESDEFSQQLAFANINFFPNPQSIISQKETEYDGGETARTTSKVPQDSITSQSTLEGSELRRTQCGTPILPKVTQNPTSEYWETQKMKPPLPTTSPQVQKETIQKCQRHPQKKVGFHSLMDEFNSWFLI